MRVLVATKSIPAKLKSPLLHAHSLLMQQATLILFVDISKCKIQPKWDGQDAPSAESNLGLAGWLDRMSEGNSGGCTKSAFRLCSPYDMRWPR
eukprot:scaffold129806_cov23-Tisochrysis_lutea.AAC.1